MAYVLGLDLGTSALKAVLMTEKGEWVAEASSDYPFISEKKGYSEQNPAEWVGALHAVFEVLHQKVSNLKEKLAGISFSGQMHSLVVMDSEMKVVRPAILWNDVRTTEACQFIYRTMPDIREITRNPVLEGFTLPKLVWLTQNEPETWRQAAHFCLPKDYLAYILTGELCTDYSDAAGTLLLDVTKKVYSDEILNAFQIPKQALPKLVSSTTCIGAVTVTMAQKLGIKTDVKVFMGGADNAVAAIGSGITRPGLALSSIGTSGVFLNFESNVLEAGRTPLHFFNHIEDTAFYSMGVTLSAGNSLNWFKREFAPEESFDELFSSASRIPVGALGLLFTPYISGERTPYTDSEIRGAFIGIDGRHTRSHFMRAVLEGITFSLRDTFELLKLAGRDAAEIIAVGGGAKNPLWLQMQADIYNRNVRTLANEQGPGVGAAMIAATGLNYFSSLNECAKLFVTYSDKIYTPNEENALAYEKIYAIYREIYKATKPLSMSLAKL
ncbi:xylulose kinase [Listeria fleischmannii 1991]|uniref:Xylulose kinase n=2 Tax=Listeria fleischmannii TaxID=1069827 RepID=A0A2X3HHR7_9LIST|nr:xylulokinase [Listeria fleischmannii]EMG29389.1 xylulose kinase [Listeria fleischmannii subsp. fleischmannii LU2006-1]KMT58692.1 xylulose kinase [Listeria fleischmannii 1991]SQC71801.1 Xylulose kinase [Listeria fleischmannii subsp. fleischmannii]